MKYIIFCLILLLGSAKGVMGQNCDAFNVVCSAYSQTVYNRYDFSNNTGMPSTLTCNYFGLDSTDYVRLQIGQPYSIRNQYCVWVKRIIRDGMVADSVGWYGNSVRLFNLPGMYEIYFETYAPLTQRVIYLNITYDNPSGINQLPIGEKQVLLTPNNTLQVEGMDIEGTSTLSLYDVSGRLLCTEQFDNPRGETWVSRPISTELPAGIYFWQIQHAEKGLLGSGKLPKF